VNTAFYQCLNYPFNFGVDPDPDPRLNYPFNFGVDPDPDPDPGSALEKNGSGSG